jgi:hypothetical protein
MALKDQRARFAGPSGSAASAIALCMIALAALYGVRAGSRFRFGMTAPMLGIEAEGEVERRRQAPDRVPVAPE